jgi:demethylmenaquinone methyltransferase/2-methoxy-6-polyprenyl-1,4-benzoquinol methylase
MGVGTAWITHGLQERNDVDVITVERDAATAQEAASGDWPTWVRLINGDALDVLQRLGTFNLIFADAEGGKWEGLGTTIAALRPGGHLLVDDMSPELFTDANYAHKTWQVRSRLLSRPDLISVEMAWSSGLILSTKRSP